MGSPQEIWSLREGNSGRGQELVILQESAICKASLWGGGPPSHRVSSPPAPNCSAGATEPAFALLALRIRLGKDSRQRGEQSPAPAWPDPYPTLSGGPESAHTCSHPQPRPCPALGRVAVPKPCCASGFGSWDPREVARDRDRISETPQG